MYVHLQSQYYQVIKGVWLQNGDDEYIGKPAEECKRQMYVKPSSLAMTKFSNDGSLEVLQGSNKQKWEGMISQI